MYNSAKPLSLSSWHNHLIDIEHFGHHEIFIKGGYWYAN